jgi:hypothetical protein
VLIGKASATLTLAGEFSLSEQWAEAGIFTGRSVPFAAFSADGTDDP